MELAYNGKNYFGWQIQPNIPSVQETIEYCLSTILNEPISIVGAGRTDAGVHAKQMYAHFDIDTNLKAKHLKDRMNSFLPKDICIYQIFKVDSDVHCRFDAISRVYEYHISLSKDPFEIDFSYQIYHNRYDMDKMNQACKILYEYKDYKCFSKSKTQVYTNNCDIQEACWVKQKNKLIFRIQANRFLRNMVRAIVGTMLEVGESKINIEDFRKIIEHKDRNNAGTSVPARALYLTEITYPKSIYDTKDEV